jgi:SAM-dependent methyltransferase/glycosyltransferase involved in cell wall biosynthesis
VVIININKDKPSIIFFTSANVKFNGNSINERPISGSETAMIQMAKNFKKLDYNVFVFCNTDKEDVYDGVYYFNSNSLISKVKEINNVDIFVSSRDIRPFLKSRPPAKINILWVHDMPGELYNGIKKAENNLDFIFFVSNYQAKEFQKMYNISSSKIHVTSNGIDKSMFDNRIQKVKGKCIYATTPFRGLDLLLDMWPEIKTQVPWASLDVYSNMSIYDMDNDDKTKILFERCKQLKKYDVHLKDPILQKSLIDELQSSELMVYPNTYLETSCISVMQAIQADVVTVTSNLGALPETLRGNGILIDGTPGSYEYNKYFVQCVVQLLKEEQKIRIDKSYIKDWKDIANEWNFLFKSISLSTMEDLKVKYTKDGKVNFNTKDYWDKHYKIDYKYKEATREEERRFEHVKNYFNGEGNVLDIGCGMGNFIKYLYETDNTLTVKLFGVDITSFAIDIAKNNVPTAKFEVISEEPNLLPFKEKFRYITAFHVLEHLEDPKEYIDLWKKSLTTGGQIIAIIPLEDEEYHQHLKIWTLGDVDNFVKTLNTDLYYIETRDGGFNYSNGRRAKEAIIRMWF